MRHSKNRKGAQNHPKKELILAKSTPFLVSPMNKCPFAEDLESTKDE